MVKKLSGAVSTAKSQVKAAADARVKAEKETAAAKAKKEKEAAAAKAKKEKEAAAAKKLAEERAKFKLNVANGSKKIPIQLKKWNKKIMVISAGAGDGIKSVTSSKPKNVKASFTGKKVKLRGLKNKKTATITVTSKLGAVITFTVKVQKKKVATKKILAPKSPVTLTVGQKLDLGPMLIKPVTTADKLKFKTSKKKVATVSKKGVITAKKAGKATITIKSGKKVKKLKVVVKKK